MNESSVQAPARAFVFGQWVLQSNDVLLHDGRPVHLPPKETHVLRLLLEAAGSLVSKNRLLDEVWMHGDVAEESLTRCIYVLRKMFGRRSSYIKTVYGKGYRFTGHVIERLSEEDTSSVPSLLILPPVVADEGAEDMHHQVVHLLTAAFARRLRILPAGLAYDESGQDNALSLIERTMPDFYLSLRCTRGAQGWGYSVELVRAAGHVLVHSQVRGTALDIVGLARRLSELLMMHLPGLAAEAAQGSEEAQCRDFIQAQLELRRYTAQSLKHARLAFERCVRRDPGHAPAWCGIADTWLSLVSLELVDREYAFGQAQEALARAAEQAPGDPDTLVRLALLASLQGVGELAQALFSAALPRAEQRYGLYCHAWHQWLQGRAEEALASARRSLLLAPDCIASWALCMRIAKAVGPQVGLAHAEEAIGVLGSGHPQLDALHVRARQACRQAGLPGAGRVHGLRGALLLAAPSSVARRLVLRAGLAGRGGLPLNGAERQGAVSIRERLRA